MLEWVAPKYAQPEDVNLWVNGVQDAPIFGDDVDRLAGNAATRQGLGRGTG